MKTCEEDSLLIIRARGRKTQRFRDKQRQKDSNMIWQYFKRERDKQTGRQTNSLIGRTQKDTERRD